MWSFARNTRNANHERNATMKTTRIELEGSAGHVTIERKTGSRTIRIDAITRDPKPGQQAWKTWEVDAGISNDDLYAIAQEVHIRCAGGLGTNSDVYGYYAEMQRFQD
jgi:hypothetical protein